MALLVAAAAHSLHTWMSVCLSWSGKTGRPAQPWKSIIALTWTHGVRTSPLQIAHYAHGRCMQEVENRDAVVMHMARLVSGLGRTTICSASVMLAGATQKISKQGPDINEGSIYPCPEYPACMHVGFRRCETARLIIGDIVQDALCTFAINRASNAREGAMAPKKARPVTGGTEAYSPGVGRLGAKSFLTYMESIIIIGREGECDQR